MTESERIAEALKRNGSIAAKSSDAFEAEWGRQQIKAAAILRQHDELKAEIERLKAMVREAEEIHGIRLEPPA